MLSQPLLIWYEGAACAEWARTSSRGHHLPRVGLPAARQVYRLKLPRTFQWHGDEKVRALGQVRVGQIDIDRRQSSIVYARVARAYVCRVLSQVPVRYFLFFFFFFVERRDCCFFSMHKMNIAFFLFLFLYLSNFHM